MASMYCDHNSQQYLWSSDKRSYLQEQQRQYWDPNPEQATVVQCHFSHIQSRVLITKVMGKWTFSNLDTLGTEEVSLFGELLLFQGL